MTVFSELSAYQYQNLQDLMGFLALISTATWVSVVFVTGLRFAVKSVYKRKTKRFQKLQKGRS